MPDPTLLLKTSRFDVVEQSRDLADGTRHTRQWVKHPGAVVILPIVDSPEMADPRICLIRNYRVAIGDTLIELPAGTLEPGEPPISTAERELIEETGYRAEHLEEQPAFYLSPGILNECMHSFVATGLTAGEAAREVGEEIENFVVPFSEAIAMIKRGEIIDAKTIVTLLHYKFFQSAPS